MPIDLSNTTQVAIPYRDKTATYERRIFRWTGPNPYVTGGEATDLLNTFGLGRVPTILMQPATNVAGTAILLLRWNRTTSKMQWYDMAGAEIANGTDLSGYVAHGEAIGR